MPLVWASKLLGVPLKGRVTGSDLVPRLAKKAAEHNKSIYLLGGRGNIGKEAAKVLKQRYPGLKIAGYESPFVHITGEEILDDQELDQQVIEHINRSNADILLIGFGNPKQELWFERNRNRLKVPVSIGIGGTYEFIAGTITRAPVWMQRSGLEWLFRIPQSPVRLLKRFYTGVSKFGLMVLPIILHHMFKRLSLKLCREKELCQNIQDSAAIASASCSTKVISLPSHLDVTVLDWLRKETEERIIKDPDVIIDFSNVTFIDLSGLGFLINLWRQSRLKEKFICFAAIKPSIEHFLKMNRVWDIFKDNMCHDINEALTLLKEKGDLPSFHYVVEYKNNVTLLNLYGRLDAAQMSSLDLESIVNDVKGRDCIMNLKDLDFVDSSGLVFFLKIQRKLMSQSRKCLLFGLTDNVKQVFNITKLYNAFQIAKDFTSANRMLGMVI